MRQLLIKEFRLTASPLTFLFILFAAMVLIPGYPILVNAFFICLGIFYTFQFAREYNDVLYTALLPVQKSDVVRARCAFVITIQMIAFALCTILTIVRMTFMADSKTYLVNPLMNANLVYLGAYLIIMALFQLIFVIGFFKTSYYFGKPFVVFIVAAFLVIGVMETLHHIPGLEILNTCGWTDMGVQTAALLIGVVVYVLSTWIAMRKSIKYFEEIDL